MSATEAVVPATSELLLIASMNHKGGVAKTNLTSNLAVLFAQTFGKTLVIDSDQQGSLTVNLGCDKFHPGLNQVLSGEASLMDSLQPAKHEPRLSVLGPGHGLEYLGRPENVEESGNKPELSALNYAQRLNDEIATANGFADEPFKAVFFDMPPGFSMITDVVLLTVKRVIIPMTPAPESVDAVGALIEEIGKKRRWNPELGIFGVVITRYKKNQDQEKYIKLFNDNFPPETVFFNTIIPENQGTASAGSFAKPAVLYDRDGSGAKAYRKLFKEFCNGLTKESQHGA